MPGRPAQSAPFYPKRIRVKNACPDRAARAAASGNRPAGGGDSASRGVDSRRGYAPSSISASSSAVRCCISARSPRASTFRRSSGSVLDLRRLKRQSAKLMSSPSV